MAQRSLLLVPDALKDPNWDHNPDIELGMVSYLGFPLFKIQEHEVPENLKITIFRVLKEALSNIFKHSKADLVRLFLGKTDSEIELVIEDNGLGFDPEDVLSREYSRKGIGLTSMRK